MKYMEMLKGARNGDEGISIPRENRDLIYPLWLEGLNGSSYDKTDT
jgi:hypothetical protein